MKQWTDEDVNTFVTMYNDGATIQQIANSLDTSRNAVKMFAQRHRKRLGLARRIDRKQPPKSPIDKQWHGCVPFGHWTITKQWSTK